MNENDRFQKLNAILRKAIGVCRVVRTVIDIGLIGFAILLVTSDDATTMLIGIVLGYAAFNSLDIGDVMKRLDEIEPDD